MYYIIRIAKVSGGVKGKRGGNRVPGFSPGFVPTHPRIKCGASSSDGCPRLGARKRFGYTSGMIAFIMEI